MKSASEFILETFEAVVNNNLNFQGAMARVTKEEYAEVCTVEDCIFLADYLERAGENQPGYLEVLQSEGYDLTNIGSRHFLFPLTTLMYSFAGAVAQKSNMKGSLILLKSIERVFLQRGFDVEAAKCMSSQSSILENLGNLEQALELLEKAVPVLEKYNSTLLTSVVEQKKALTRKLQQPSSKVDTQYVHARELEREGYKLMMNNQLESAEPLLIEACGIFEMLDKFAEKARTIAILSMIYVRTGRHQEAIHILEANLGDDKEMSEIEAKGLIHSQLGSIHFSIANYAASLYHYQSAYNCFATKDLWVEAADCYWQKGKCLNELQRYEEAEEDFKVAGDIFKQNGMDLNAARVDLSTALMHFGLLKTVDNAFVLMAKFMLIRNLLDSALQVFEKHSSWNDIGNYYLNSGNLEYRQYHTTGNYSDALSDYQKAIQIFDHLKEKRMANIARINLSRLLMDLGQSKEAAALMEQIED